MVVMHTCCCSSWEAKCFRDLSQGDSTADERRGLFWLTAQRHVHYDGEARQWELEIAGLIVPGVGK